MRLSDIEPGQMAVVLDLDVAAEESDRLKAMGLCAGRRLQLIKRGDPLIVRVVGTRIGLSARLAACVMVELCHPQQGACPLPTPGKVSQP